MKHSPTTYRLARTTCGECIHHQQHMMKSGEDPVYVHFCNHPLRRHRAEMLMPIGHDIVAKRIGRDDETPEWCPYLTGEEAAK